MPIPSREAIRNRFQSHAASPATQKVHTMVTNATEEMANLICETTMDSRQQAIALTKLEEVRMWWNQAVALDGQGFEAGER